MGPICGGECVGSRGSGRGAMAVNGQPKPASSSVRLRQTCSSSRQTLARRVPCDLARGGPASSARRRLARSRRSRRSARGESKRSTRAVGQLERGVEPGVHLEAGRGDEGEAGVGAGRGCRSRCGGPDGGRPLAAAAGSRARSAGMRRRRRDARSFGQELLDPLVPRPVAPVVQVELAVRPRSGCHPFLSISTKLGQ